MKKIIMKSTLSQMFFIGLGIAIGVGLTTLYKTYNVNKNTFFLGITITFKSIEDKEEFKSLFTPLAKFVKANEPHTLSYELCERYCYYRLLSSLLSSLSSYY